MDAALFYGQKRVSDGKSDDSPGKEAKLRKIQFSILAPIAR
jgi:hypothetical protein